MSGEEDKEARERICKAVLSYWNEGFVVYADIEGLKKIPFEEFIKQPLEGMLYDINRSLPVILSFLDDPKWVNDYAMYRLVEYYHDRCKELEEKLKEYEGKE